ncbi:CDK5 regulatory subunit-associated protein 3-like isoform X2 [Littorina saxatilis]|uniref:CDK5 regulatory subunit-associated protein 3 n=1 Tax=Littorina saxatilis TaxID=31220 RepID=A0AAN9G2I3_9CAEN
MESLPIDINYNKLLDWLINRRHCGQQWQPQAAVIRQKIIRCVENMGDDQAAQGFSEPSEVTYFQIKELLAQSKDTESGKKNFFGQYSSQNMQDWAEIIKLYERDGVNLAETTQTISRYVNYEIPAVKKQITKCQQLQKECERKEAEYANNAADLRKKYAASCRQMGIEGQKIKTELAAMVRDLPADFDRMAASTQELEGAVKYYDAFVNFLVNREQSDSVPMLKFVQSRGNVRVYEWRTGSPPEVTEEQSIKIDLSDEQDLTNESEDIDWGGGDDDNGIDFGAEIDFGIADITVEDGGQEEQGNGDWVKVTAEDAASLPEVTGVARGEDALSVLDNPNTRNLFIDDLMELESFLTQRVQELAAPDAAMSGNQFQGAPADVQLDASEVEAMLDKVQGIVGQLTSVQMQHLMLIRSSPRYVDRLRDSLRQTLIQADKLVLAGQEAASRRRAALEEEQQLEPRLDAMKKHVRSLQKHLEAEISEKYKGRQVNIMGEINMI